MRKTIPILIVSTLVLAAPAFAQETPPDLREIAAKASVAEREKRWETALELYRRGVELGPEHAHLMFGLGRCLSRLGRYEEAVAVYERLIAAHPDKDEVAAAALRSLEEARALKEEHERRTGEQPRAVAELAHAAALRRLWAERGLTKEERDRRIAELEEARDRLMKDGADRPFFFGSPGDWPAEKERADPAVRDEAWRLLRQSDARAAIHEFLRSGEALGIPREELARLVHEHAKPRTEGQPPPPAPAADVEQRLERLGQHVNEILARVEARLRDSERRAVELQRSVGTLLEDIQRRLSVIEEKLERR